MCPVVDVKTYFFDYFCLTERTLPVHGSVLLFDFALERVLTSEDKGWLGMDSGEGGLESGTNMGGLTTLSFTSLLLSLFSLKCLSQWFTNVSSLTKVLLHTLQ